MQRLPLIAIAMMLSQANFAHAQWGSLKGKVTVEGEIVEVKPLFLKGNAPKDNEVCGAQDMPDDSLVIDADSKGLANVVVWLAKKPAKIHPALAKPAQAVIEFDNVKCRFEPHVLIVRTGQEVKLLNADSVGHNTNFAPVKGQGFNPALAPLDRKGDLRLIKTAERLPAPVSCGIHPWMKAHWLIVDHPYAAVSDKDGNFEIKDLPAGEHEFKVWHENPGYLVKDKKDPKQGLIASIKADETLELPDIKVPFEKLQVK